MLKWTTSGSLNDSDSVQVQCPGVERSTVQAFSSVITQLTRMSNPDHASVDSDETDDFQGQVKHTPQGGRERHASIALTTATTSPPRRRTLLRGLKRSASLSRGDRDPRESESFRHGSSRSLPTSPQTSQSTDERQKKTGVLEKFRKFFRTAKSANKIYQIDSASGGKFSPGRARKRSRSPVKTQDTGNLKGPSSSKTRLTRLIETKREERKQIRSNASKQKFAPYKSESASSEEEHPYVQHGQVDKTLFLQNESSLRFDTRERTGYELLAPNLRQKSHRNRQHAKVDSTIFSNNEGFSELEAGFQRQVGPVACLQRSSSLRLSINEHNLQYSKTGVFEQGNTDSFTNPQRRRWSSQSTNTALRSSNYEKDSQPLPNVLPRSGSGVMSQLAKKPSCSEESLFNFGESLVTMIEAGSLRKVKVMPSRPDTIIQVKKSLSPVYRNPPLTFHENVVITPRKATQDVKEKFRWSVTADGGMIITPTKESGRLVNISHKQSDVVSHTGIPGPRNNNNGRAKKYGSKNIHHTEQETSDTFLKMSDVNEESGLHNGQVQSCVAPPKHDALECATTIQDNTGVSCESPLGLYVDTDGKSEISRVRVKDIVKSIEEQYEQCEGIRKRGFPDYTQTILMYTDTGGVESETCRSTDPGHGSGKTAEIPPGWIKDPGQEMDNKVNDTCPTNPTVKRTHNYSSCESEGFSPKVSSSVSEARCSFPLTSQGIVVGQVDRQMESPTESDICESPGDTRTCSSVSPQSSNTPSIPSDMINDTWTFPSDVQGVFSDSSDVGSLVRNIASTNRVTKPTCKASTTGDIGDKASEQYKETEQVTADNKECNNIFRSEELTNREIEAPETEHYDVTKESLVSPNRRNVSSPVSILLSMNNLEEGITDVKAPLTMVPQDSSALEGTEDSNADLPEEQLSELSAQQHQNSALAKTTFQASPIQSPMADRRPPGSSPLQQKNSALGHREHVHPIISEVKQTESMHSTESDSQNTGFLQTSDFEQEEAEQLNPSSLPDRQTKLPQSENLHAGESKLPAVAVSQQEQQSLFKPTTTKGTSPNYERLRHKRSESLKVPRQSQALTSSSSQADSWDESRHETVFHAAVESGNKRNDEPLCGESLKQTNMTVGETKLSKSTQAQSGKPTQLSEKVDSKQSTLLLADSLPPSISIQPGKVGSLNPTDSSEGPDAPVSSPCVATEHGTRSGDDKPSLNVKPKKKVSFNLGASRQDNVSSLSDVAVIEEVPRVKAKPADQQNVKGVTAELDHSDSVSSTDVSSSFSFRSNDGQGVPQQVTSTSGDDVSWWGPDVVDDMDFFHDEVNDKTVNWKTVNDEAVTGNTVNDKDDNDKTVNDKTVNVKNVKDTEDEHNTDTTKQTANLNLLTTNRDIDHDDTTYSSATSLSENKALNSLEMKRQNALNNKRSEIHSWLNSEAAEYPTSKDRQDILDRKSDGNKDTTSARKSDENSDKNVPEKIQEHLLFSGRKSPQEPSKCQNRDTCRADSGITDGDGSVHKIDFGNTNRDGKVYKTDPGITNRDGDVGKIDPGSTNKDGHAPKTDSGIRNGDGNVDKKDHIIINRHGSVFKTNSDIINRDGNVDKKDHSIINRHGSVYKTDSDIINRDGNVDKKDHSIINRHGSVYKTNSDIINRDGNVDKKDHSIINRHGSVYKTNSDIINREGPVHKLHFGITNAEKNVQLTDSDIKNKDRNVRVTDSSVTNDEINVRLTDSDIKNKDRNVRATDSSVTNDEINVQLTDSDFTNQDSSVHLADSDITNEGRNLLNDSDFTDEDEKDSLSDTNSRTYDVSGTLAKYKKVTAPWWEKPKVVDELSIDSCASEDEEPSSLPEDLKRQQTAPTASRLSQHLHQSPPKGCTIHADVKLYDQEIVLPQTRTLQHFRSKSPSKKSPKMYFKEISLQERSGKHGDNQKEQIADEASVHLYSSSESLKFPGRNCMRILSPRKQQALLIEERKRFVFTKRNKRATGPDVVKANNDHTKTSCDGDQNGPFEFRNRSRVDDLVSVRADRGRYGSDSRGPYEVLNKIQTCDRRAGKTSLLNNASSPGNITSRGILLVEDMSPSSPSLATKRRSDLGHTNCRSGLGKTSEGQTYEAFSPLQQTRIRGKSPHKRLNVLNGPSQTNLSKCVKSISLVDEETALAQESKRSSADHHHAVTPHTTPKAPNNPPEPNSTDSINSLNCVSDYEHGQDIQSKTSQRRNQKTERRFKSRVHSRMDVAYNLLDSYLTKGQLLLDNPSESEDQERDSESEDQERDSESEGQERLDKSSQLRQCQQQPSPDDSTCSFGTIKASRQDVLDIRGSCYQTDHTSLPNASSSLYSQNYWTQGTKSHRNLARPGVSKLHCKWKSGPNESTYPSKSRSDSPTTRGSSTDWPNSPASKYPDDDWFDASRSELGFMGHGDASTPPKSRLDSQPGQWLFIATFFVFQIFLHWLYAR